ncbi:MULTISPECIES: hypothetical protein [unclassified Clostridium]|uniref:hypothetical protein n=1 Tax=unclassified Clostridium TaxID=2614128 RepID=UPI00207A7482|nr:MULTISPECIES: hypothetical protein [unclassified Clostridium]
MECINCKKDKKKSNFYEGFNECKDCIKFKIDNIENHNVEQCIINILYDNGYKFNEECFNSCFDKISKPLEGLSNNGRFKEYLKRINSLPQYEDYRYGNKNNYSQVTIKPDGVTCTFGEFKIMPNSLVESLINEENELLRKIKHSRDSQDFGTYKNLIRALTDITTLKNRELDRFPKDKWESVYSHYKEKNENGDFEDMVATWEKKGEDIRNHKIYKIEKEINKPIEKLYFDVSRDSDAKTLLYFKNKIYRLKDCTYENIVNKIKEITCGYDIEIYGDIFGIGLGLADYLYKEGFIVKPTTLELYNPKDMMFCKKIEQNYIKNRLKK